MVWLMALNASMQSGVGMGRFVGMGWHRLGPGVGHSSLDKVLDSPG